MGAMVWHPRMQRMPERHRDAHGRQGRQGQHQQVLRAQPRRAPAPPPSASRTPGRTPGACRGTPRATSRGSCRRPPRGSRGSCRRCPVLLPPHRPSRLPLGARRSSGRRGTHSGARARARVATALGSGARRPSRPRRSIAARLIPRQDSTSLTEQREPGRSPTRPEADGSRAGAPRDEPRHRASQVDEHASRAQRD